MNNMQALICKYFVVKEFEEKKSKPLHANKTSAASNGKQKPYTANSCYKLFVITT